MSIAGIEVLMLSSAIPTKRLLHEARAAAKVAYLSVGPLTGNRKYRGDAGDFQPNKTVIVISIEIGAQRVHLRYMPLK